jgi:glutaredoxin
MRKLALTLGLICTIVLLPTAYGVKLYKWVDEDGNVTYHDRPPPEAGYSVERKDFKLGGRTTRSDSEAGKAADESPVVLYTAPKCTACDLARAYLDRRNVPFTDKNVSGDAEAIKELQEKSGALTVPTIMVGSKVMKGYMESLLEGELDDAGYPKLEQPAQPTEEAEEQEEQ